MIMRFQAAAEVDQRAGGDGGQGGGANVEDEEEYQDHPLLVTVLLNLPAGVATKGRVQD